MSALAMSGSRVALCGAHDQSCENAATVPSPHDASCSIRFLCVRPPPPPPPPPLTPWPSGRYLLATTLDSTARLVDYEAGAALKTYRGHTASSYCIPPAWVTNLPSGRPALASGSEDGSVVVWDVDSRQVRWDPRDAGGGVWDPTNMIAWVCGSGWCTSQHVLLTRLMVLGKGGTGWPWPLIAHHLLLDEGCRTPCREPGCTTAALSTSWSLMWLRVVAGCPALTHGPDHMPPRRLTTPAAGHTTAPTCAH